MEPILPMVEQRPTAVPRIGVGKSSAVYTKAVEKAPDAPILPRRTSTILPAFESGMKADPMQARPQTRKLKRFSSNSYR